MVRFEENVYESEGKPFCEDSVFFLSRSREDLEVVGKEFSNQGFKCRKFDITNIPSTVDEKSILLISNDVMIHIEPEVYDEKIKNNHYVYSYSEKLDQSRTFPIEGQILLPVTSDDVKNLVSISKLKSNYERKLEDLETYKSNVMKVSSLGQFAGSLVHDLNNYNTICMTSLDGLRIINQRTHKDEKIDFLVLKGLKGSKMINSLSKKYRKFLYSDKEVAPEYCNIQDLVEETIEFINKDIVQNQIKVTSKIAQDFFVFCNNVSFIQVLMNLLTNSIYAIKGLEKRWIEISIKRTKGGMTLLVKDSGSGIDREVQEKMFEPLYSTKPDLEGAGFGLSFCDTELSGMGMKLLYIEAKNTVFGIHIPKEFMKKTMIK